MENLQHYILSNRKVKWNSKDKFFSFDLDSRIQPNLPLHYTVYDFTGKKLNEHSDLPNAVTPVIDGSGFIAQVVAEAEKLPAECRNVTFYIHGFHHILQRSFKLDILSGMANAYCQPANRVVGKFIFFSWPATEGRNILDDRAHAQGVMLYRNNKKMFENLAAELDKRGIQFNLMAHSFGHRILNGFLEAAETGKKIFDRVFLFAADIPHTSLDTTLPGVKLKNKKNSDWDGDTPDDDTERWYNLTRLQGVATETHCFYCKYDRMLMASTDGEIKRSDEDDTEQVNEYLCLGTMGNTGIKFGEKTKFYDVEPWVRLDGTFDGVLDKNKHVLKQMDDIIQKFNLSVSDHRAFALLKFSRDPWVKLHRYAYYSQDVVKQVGSICRQEVKPDTPVIT